MHLAAFRLRDSGTQGAPRAEVLIAFKAAFNLLKQ